MRTSSRHLAAVRRHVRLRVSLAAGVAAGLRTPRRWGAGFGFSQDGRAQAGMGLAVGDDEPERHDG